MKIVGFGQQMMLEGAGRIQHEISVELNDGSVHVLPTDEKTVQKLISLFQSIKAPTAHVERARPVVEPVFDEPAQVQDFGEEEQFEEDPGETYVPVRGRNRPAFLSDDEDGSQV